MIEGRVVVVTGASRGIGQATARLMAKHGAHVACLSRSQTELDALIDELNGLGKPGSRHCAIAVDLRDHVAIESAFQRLEEVYGHIDILVNNAGTAQQITAAQMSHAEWRSCFEVNLDAVFLCCQQAMARMAPQGGGSIVNIGSIAGTKGVEKFPGFVGYASAKSALVGFTEALAAELKEASIRVNTVAPGAVATKLLSDVAPDLRAKAQPEDIAKIVLFFADNDQSAVVTGSVLDVFCNDFIE